MKLEYRMPPLSLGGFNESVVVGVVSLPSEHHVDTDTLQQGGLLCDEVMYVYV